MSTKKFNGVIKLDVRESTARLAPYPTAKSAGRSTQRTFRFI